MSQERRGGWGTPSTVGSVVGLRPLEPVYYQDPCPHCVHLRRSLREALDRVANLERTQTVRPG
ncbi:MAG: hypothetical protein DDT20_00934 [Firmicutes bacterium]|nr:hypothetical protein [Bacillota bacterium]